MSAFTIVLTVAATTQWGEDTPKWQWVHSCLLWCKAYMTQEYYCRRHCEEPVLQARPEIIF